MTAHAPAYRLTMYSPRSVDATEATILTPIGGAAHADNFVVASISGVSGAQPYLEHPRGKQGSIDPLTKKTTQGALTVRIMDKRVTAGGSNSSRWLTAFLGDTSGKQRLIGCKVYIEESLNGGSSWAAFFTGRVFDLSLSGDAIFWDLQIRDMSAELDRKVFVGRPHATVASTAFMPSVTPLGPPFDWGNLTAVPRLRGTITRVSATVATLTIDPKFDHWSRIWTANIAGANSARLWHLMITYAGNTGAFLANPRTYIPSPISKHDGKPWHPAFGGFRSVEELPVGTAGYMAMPPNGAAVTFYATIDTPPTKDFPLLINDIHPVQLWAYLLDGYFSTLKPDGSAVAISARDTAAFATLIADDSFNKVPMRLLIDEPVKASEFIEKHICQVYQLAYRLDGSGQVVPIDLRRSSTTASGGTITDADLAAGPAPAWKVSRDSAITGAVITYYYDTPVSVESLKDAPDVAVNYPSTGIETLKSDVFVANDLTTFGDIGEKVIKIDAKGLHLSDDEAKPVNGHDAISAARDVIVGWADDAMTPYATGAATLPLRCRRGATPVDTCFPGLWRTVTVTTQPDPASNTRGGSRLMLCTSRSEDGPTVNLEFLDAGVGSVSVTPTVTSALAAIDDDNAVDVVVTLNAQGERAAVYYAITDTSTGSRPVDADARWIRSGARTTTGTLRVRGMPKSARVWIRARSEPIAGQFRLPSAWVYRAAPGYVDTVTVTAASAASVTNLFANRGDVSWTAGDANSRVEISLVLGGVPGSWTDADRIASLDPGATKYRVKNLAASTQYTVGIRVREVLGGRASLATATFTTTSTLGDAPRPVGLDICVRPSA